MQASDEHVLSDGGRHPIVRRHLADDAVSLRRQASQHIFQISAGQRPVTAEFAAAGPRRRPGRSAIGLVNDEKEKLSDQLCLLGALVLQIIQILEEEYPLGLFGVIQLRGATRLFPEHAVDVAEGLFKHFILRSVGIMAKTRPYGPTQSSATIL
ncbi:hypothetical protein MA04_03838 [Alcanivorax balearicus MACL04]|uniref:Uncharacterized protein n=1 Tax=Alloalcanivorax balearicus MACL04 TaxID=1177182 RepID=A0ABT2R438_9GAMM|nr:hypothetical protein [Alloalcanivorax balearicus MACL04]